MIFNTVIFALILSTTVALAQQHYSQEHDDDQTYKHQPEVTEHHEHLEPLEHQEPEYSAEQYDYVPQHIPKYSSEQYDHAPQDIPQQLPKQHVPQYSSYQEHSAKHHEPATSYQNYNLHVGHQHIIKIPVINHHQKNHHYQHVPLHHGSHHY